MTFTSAETLFTHLVELGMGGGNPEPLPKKLTLFDGHRREHFVAELDGNRLDDAEFFAHLSRVFRRPRGGHLVCRLPMPPHTAGRSGRLVQVPDRVTVFTISSGKAVKLSGRDTAVAQGRLNEGQAEQYGKPRWREQERKPENAQMEAV